MSRTPLLYNFTEYQLPDGVKELLDLLGFFAMWNRREQCWQVYERPTGYPRRMRWTAMSFIGGDMRAWQQFLSDITATEHVL